MRALSVAHRFLSKPCDVETLRLVIEQAARLQTLLSDEGVRRVIGKLDKLPSVPKTYHELMRVSADPKAGIADVARIVEQDSAMSVKVLQIVNSAYFGLAQRMTSVGKAVVYLGVEMLKGLTLVAHVFATMESAPVEGFSLERLQHYSLLTARLAKRFLRDPKRAGEAFTAALVHDVGRVIMALSLPEKFAEIVAEVRAADLPVHAIERNHLGITHAEIGAYLLGVWGLPFPIVESVAYHHSPSQVTEGPRDVLAAVHVADALVDATCVGEREMPAEVELDMPFLQSAGFAGELDAWRSLADEEVLKCEEVR